MYFYNSMVSTESGKSVKVREFEMRSGKFIKFHDKSGKSQGVLLIHHSVLPSFCRRDQGINHKPTMGVNRIFENQGEASEDFLLIMGN